MRNVTLQFNGRALGGIAAAAVLLSSIVAPADAGTNFPAIKDYPAPNCPKPGRPPLLSDHHYGGNVSATNWWTAAEANQAYTAAAQLAYAACVNVYVANAHADMALIRSSKASTADSNFPSLRDYPAPDCARPVSQPALPDLRKAGPIAAWGALNDYRTQIAKYDAYASCMNAYTANAQADMDLILDKVNKEDDPALAAGRPDDWVTFTTGESSFGPTQHQIDRNSIREEGSYRTFWTRVWIVPLQEALVYNDVAEERLILWSQKFAVDCGHHKYGPNFIDSADPAEKNDSASLQTMPWVSLDKAPVIAGAVCEHSPQTVAATENAEPRPPASDGKSLPLAGINFPAIKTYPASTCVNVGSAPALATGFQSSRAANAAASEYFQEITQFKTAQRAHTACMDTYVANVQADLDLIRSKAVTTTLNFPALKDYPAPPCGRLLNLPTPPTWNPGQPITNAQRVKNYNAQVAIYDVYASCMNTYTANAQADMDLIRDRVNKTVAESAGTK